MSKIPKFGTSIKPNNAMMSTPLNTDTKKISGHIKGPTTNKLKFINSAELSAIENNLETSNFSTKSNGTQNSENVPLKRNGSSLQYYPKKQAKLTAKSTISSNKIPPYDFKAKYIDLLEKHQNLKEAHSSLIDERDRCADDLEKAQSSFDSLFEEKRQITNKLKESQENNSKLRDDISGLSGERDSLQSNIKELKLTIEEQQLQSSEQTMDLLKVKNELLYKTNECISLKNLMDNEIKKSLELSMKIEENAIKFTSLTTEVNFLVSSKNIIEQKNKENACLVGELKQECETLKNELESVKNKNKSLERSLEDKTNDYNKIASLHNLETIKNRDLEAALSSCQSKIATFMNDLVDSKNCSELLRMKNEDNAKQIRDLIEKNEEMQKVSESMHDNQKLLRNQIQDIKGHIRVYCRVRPLLSNENNKSTLNLDIADSCTMNLEKISSDSTGGLTKKQNFKHSFTFDGIFSPSSPQVEVFQEVSSLIQSALDGFNVCIFAYGQTGSGKTYTMEGINRHDSIGIIPRTVDMIFSNIPHLNKLGWEFQISAAFMEIYNENIYDLLDPSRDQADHSIKMMDGKGPDVYVSNLKEEPVVNADELMNLLAISQRNRQTAATLCNERSSRSHSITKIKIAAVHNGRKEKLNSCINLIDLAGSESGKTTQRMDETKSINKSLSELSKVILALQSKQSHVPFRNSKLTYLLMPSLSGNSKTLMLVNVSQFDECYLETVNSLRFAAQVNTCKTGATKKNITTMK